MTLLVKIISLLSGIFLILGYIPYIIEVFKKKTIPNRVSWFIWALSTTILLFSVLKTGTTEAIWVPIADAIGCIFIFILSLFWGDKKWNQVDVFSLVFCLVSLGIWAITGNALIALIMNLIVYVTGYIPTITKAFYHPDSESHLAWLLFLIGTTLNVVTVAIGTDTGFAVWVYPITLFLCVSILFIFLLRKGRGLTSLIK